MSYIIVGWCNCLQQAHRAIKWFRQFYRTFPIANALRSQFNWTHYRTLIRIDNQDKREFYIIYSSFCLGNGFALLAINHSR
ncbi:DUF1016 N-terminal domain-containing protein [Parapedobacter tibetensis]|uniref:DUF1016 N-terminal domain-containing protein n=1 Tax=Parapedobacter tibetensis TaxID=2972951 RepID=UPI0027E3F927|nr:DUF1016 N-terminal domain-containing protein [Parapedobacter tibetensis]